MLMFQWQDGKKVIVWPEELARAGADELHTHQCLAYSNRFAYKKTTTNPIPALTMAS